MIDEEPYDYHNYEQEPSSNALRWVVFVFALILGSALIPITVLYFPSEATLLTVVMLTPLLIFMLYAAYRWAQGKTIAPTDETADGRIFQAMRHHAIPAERVGGFEMFRCPDCGMSFELANAQPVEDKVVLCPTCNVRLFIS